MTVDDETVNRLFQRLDAEAEKGGYHLNPDSEVTKELVRGLLVNEARYGYRACPCRLSAGDEKEDLDIICPCDYRDADLNEFGACYCSLYVSKEIKDGEKEPEPIPERRPPERDQRPQFREPGATGPSSELAYPVWRCRVCGYLCAREEPPAVCPVCKATKERFERFM